jgi:hypothetical protein
MAFGESYEEFVEKFKPKKTTDDCYTPPSVYAIIRDWACNEYGIDPAKIVRPFYPGGDYERFDYPEGAVVLDNPPFSILSRICGFYLDRGISFFLFAPSLTAFSGRTNTMRMNHIICDCQIEYENGAIVKTSFVTSYGGDVVAQTESRLTKLVNDEVKRLRRTKTVQLPKYTYPDHIVTAALLQRYSRYGVDFKVHKKDCTPIYALDAQRSTGKSIFGGGLLLSDCAAADCAAADRAAAERAAAERAAATKWELSARERAIVEYLNSHEN